MKKTSLKKLKTICRKSMIVLSAILGLFITSCNDEMAPEYYYTFKGEMMSDVLKNNPDYSMFKELTERSGVMDLLSSRGSYTLFLPTNSAMALYLDENNYSSLNDIPKDKCDSLVYTHLFNYVYSTFDFADNSSYFNMIDQPVNLKVSDSLDSNKEAITFINGSAAIINGLKNDSVENGIIHPIDKVIKTNNFLGPALLEQNKDEFLIYYEAFLRTGLLDSINVYYDLDYERNKDKFPEFIEGIDTGDPGTIHVAKRPDRRLFGFSVFIVPDKILKEKGITDLKSLYDLAVEKYDDVALGLGVTDEDKAKYWNMSPESLRNPKNPLHMFMAYHIIDRFFAGENVMINCWGVNTAKANPTDWLGTFLPHSTLKIEKVYKSIDEQVEYVGEFYLNHSAANDFMPRVRGAHITIPDNYFSINCAYFYIDDVIAYDRTMQSTVMNTRLRIDAFSLFPELTTNNIRLNGVPWQHYVKTYDNSKTDFRYGINYYIPSGYLKNTKINDDGILFLMRPRTMSWCWGGDELNLLGTNYDFTFKIPSVPTGTYEIRLGYTGGYATRGIAQVYYNDVPQGLPIDMRIEATDPSIGGQFTEEVLENEELLLENNQVMKNNGCYRGPESLYSYYGDIAKNHKTPVYVPGKCCDWNTIPRMYRRILCKTHIDGSKDNFIRVRSVHSTALSCVFMLDYIEVVPNSICGVGGMGEDRN